MLSHSLKEFMMCKPRTCQVFLVWPFVAFFLLFISPSATAGFAAKDCFCPKDQLLEAATKTLAGPAEGCAMVRREEPHTRGDERL